MEAQRAGERKAATGGSLPGRAWGAEPVKRGREV